MDNQNSKKTKTKKQGKTKKTSLLSMIGTIMMAFGALFVSILLLTFILELFRGQLYPIMIIFEWWGIGFAILFLSGLLIYHLD